MMTMQNGRMWFVSTLGMLEVLNDRVDDADRYPTRFLNLFALISMET